MKRLIITGCVFFALYPAYSQSDDNLSLDFYGALRADAYFDSYKGYDLGHDLFYLLPNYEPYQDVDINKQNSSNISALGSLFGAKVKGPQFMAAKSSGLLEFDFCGNLTTASSLLRLRQAYTRLTWDQGSLLIGQTFHPFVSQDHQPVVAGMNVGAPFHAYNFSPMIRYDVYLGGMTLGLSMVAENQFTTPAADFITYINSDNHAKRNGTIPELVATLDFNINESFYFGGGAEYKRIKPRVYVTNESGEVFKAGDFLASTALMGYMRVKSPVFSFLTKVYYGENMSHLLLPGGYGVASYDVATGKETYTCYKTLTAVVNVVYGNQFRFGLFGGYGLNLGTALPLCDQGDGQGQTYGLFTSLRDMMRVAPHLSYQYGKYKFMAELEMTLVSFGQGTFHLEDGLYSSAHTSTNQRLLFTVTHIF